MADDDPTNLKNILNALNNSKRLTHWNKPPRDFGPDNPEDSDYNRNGLKDVGDFSEITISPGFSFGNDAESEGEPEPEPEPVTAKYETSYEISYLISDPGEQLPEVSYCDSLVLAQRAQEQHQILQQLEEMTLENEYRQLVHKKSKTKREDYMRQLYNIRAVFDEQVKQYYHDRDEKLELEEHRLRQQEDDVIQAVKQCENEYSKYVTERSSRLLEVVEDARRKEAEQADLRRALINQLHNIKETYVSKLTQMQQLLGEFEGSETLDSQTEGLLNQTVTRVEEVLNSANQNIATQDQLNEAQNSLQQGLSYVDTITQTLNTKKEEKAKIEAEKISREAEEAKLKAAAQLEMEKQEAARKEEQRLANEQRQEESPEVTAVKDGKKRLGELEQKLEKFFRANATVTATYGSKRMEVHRALGIINQLNLTDNRVNREKLQKLLAFLNGKEIEPGKGSTDNDPLLIDYVKNLLISNIVKLGHDKQEAGVAAYSWLLVNVVSVHPEMWDIFLYHIFTACPYLIPMYPFQEDGQSEEDFNKAVGMKNNEKLDLYLARMGNCAKMYGLVLAFINKRERFPVKAPIIGWELLAKLLSLPPVSGITSEILHNFLITAGPTLQQTYGKQFLKLMKYLNNVYMPKIVDTTEGGGAQAQNALQNLLKDFNTNHKLQQHALIDKYK